MLKDAAALSLLDTNNNISLSGAGETPDYISATDPSSWTNSNEVTGGAAWPTGGINLAVATYGPTLTQSPSKTLMWDYTTNIAVANTTTNAPAYGAYIYANGLTPKAKIIGVYFGGTGYSTVAGTFAITWNVLGVLTIQMAA